VAAAVLPCRRRRWLLPCRWRRWRRWPGGGGVVAAAVVAADVAAPDVTATLSGSELSVTREAPLQPVAQRLAVGCAPAGGGAGAAVAVAAHP